MAAKLSRMMGWNWANFALLHRRKTPGRVFLPAWATEDTHEVDQLRQAERRITAETGWNTSTLVIAQVLRQLRGDHHAS